MHDPTVKPPNVPDEWDFYLARVDDALASILLNFWFRRNSPIAGYDTLYRCRIEMLEPGEHAMGEASERDMLGAIEDEVSEWAVARGLYYVGRMRSLGYWQLAFFGPPAFGDELHEHLREVLEDTKRGFECGSQHDPEWSYFHGFLWPDDERVQWIMDRRVVDSLRQEGDPLEIERRVDHWIYFASASRRDAFVIAAEELGFGLEGARDDVEGERRFSAQIHRTDSVRLEDIHDVVMMLRTIADEHDGDYDGWETSVEKPTEH